MSWEPLTGDPMDLTSGFSGGVEFAPHFEPRQSIAYVVFDFDGTLSLIRQGWPEVMLPMFVEMLPRQEGVTVQEDETMLLDDIMTLNGKGWLSLLVVVVKDVVVVPVWINLNL